MYHPVVYYNYTFFIIFDILKPQLIDTELTLQRYFDIPEVRAGVGAAGEGEEGVGVDARPAGAAASSDHHCSPGEQKARRFWGESMFKEFHCSVIM